MRNIILQLTACFCKSVLLVATTLFMRAGLTLVISAVLWFHLIRDAFEFCLNFRKLLNKFLCVCRHQICHVVVLIFYYHQDTAHQEDAHVDWRLTSEIRSYVETLAGNQGHLLGTGGFVPRR